MDEEQRLNFNSFVDAYNAYQNPNLAAKAPAFAGYGYEAPQLNMVQAPNQFPQMSINPDAIYDPTVAAAMQILNRPMMMAQTPEMLGAGTDYQTAYSLLKEIAPTKLQQYQKIAPPPPPRNLMDYVGGGGGGDSNYNESNPDFARINLDGSYDYTGVNAPFGPGHRDYGDFNYDSFPSERGPAADTYEDRGGGYFDYGAETGYDF
jgi:hypothetical protein